MRRKLHWKWTAIADACYQVNRNRPKFGILNLYLIVDFCDQKNVQESGQLQFWILKHGFCHQGHVESTLWTSTVANINEPESSFYNSLTQQVIRERYHCPCSCPCFSTSLPCMLLAKTSKVLKEIQHHNPTAETSTHLPGRSSSASGNVLTLANIFQFCPKDIFSAYRSHKSGFLFGSTSQL